mmetsp:Transcript_26752/g.54736  ORF Transcript_26752/g.54736 Transcript_26752/m.54736 type:complete len:533 (-) Transcript_26752:63-1661(-)
MPTPAGQIALALLAFPASALQHPLPLLTRSVPLQLCPPAKASSAPGRNLRNRSGSRTRLWWRSSLSRHQDADEALKELLADAEKATKSGDDDAENTKGLAFLFVGQSHATSFERLASKFHAALNEGNDERVRTMALVGGGVIGGGNEEDSGGPAMSMLSGILPPMSHVSGFHFGGGQEVPSLSDPAWSELAMSSDVDDESIAKSEGERSQRAPSFMVFVDPWSPISSVIEGLDKNWPGGVVAGGISCPVINAPTVALDGRALANGSIAGICLTGNIGLQAVVAQGCRPVGPAFVVSSTRGNAVTELSSAPALEQLSKVMQEVSDGDKALIQSGGLLCGVVAPNEDGQDCKSPKDYLVRQIMGLVPQSGAIIIGTDDVKEGDILRFHVRDGQAAKEDMQLMVHRAKTERVFAGTTQAGMPLAAVQVSCVARGRSLFGTPNYDIVQAGELLEIPGSSGNSVAGSKSNADCMSAIAGFFANGEIGPVGISGFGSSSLSPSQTHMHGFTTVVAILCHFDCQEKSQNGGLEEESAWE